MKRVRIAPGKFVVITNELAEKAAHVFGAGLTRDQVRDLKASEPKVVKGLMAGSRKPLAIARRSLDARAESVAMPAHESSASIASRRKDG